SLRPLARLAQNEECKCALLSSSTAALRNLRVGRSLTAPTRLHWEWRQGCRCNPSPQEWSSPSRASHLPSVKGLCLPARGAQESANRAHLLTQTQRNIRSL